MSIYSTLLYSASAPNGSTPAYTVPAGTTVVVRDIEAFNSQGAATALSVTRNVSGLVTSFIYVVEALGAQTWSQWKGRAVLNPADVLEVNTGAVGVYLHISGYVLS